MKILLAVDDSWFSKAAAKTLVQLVKPGSARVRVLHVVGPPLFPADDVNVIDAQVRQGERIAGAVAAKLAKAGFKAETSVLQGDIRHTIVDTADKWGADLVVMGSHGRTGLQRLLLGSVAEFVARRARCSVQIVRSSDAAA